MKRFDYIVISLVLAGVWACTPSVHPACGERILLDKGWELSRSGAKESVKTDVPATVAGALAESGYFGTDLMAGRNYASVDKSIFDDEWVWKTSFKAAPAGENYTTLDFEGLDYYADIFLNGKQIASADTTFGVFCRRSYEVGSILRGSNTLEVRLRRAQPGDLNIGFVDWNPRPLDESMGIVRPVSLHTTGALSIEDVFVIPDLNENTLAEADLEVRVTIRNHAGQPVEGALKLDLQDGGEGVFPVSLEAGQTATLAFTPEQAAFLHLDRPRVWWSHDLGSPELYRLSASVEAGGSLSDCRDAVFGVRKITSRLTSEGFRQFTLNGRDILLRGAGWTDDIFLRDTRESILRQVEYVKDMNMNCIRFENIWGKDDTVYDICDSLGVLCLVGWSCQWEWKDYCGLPETRGYGCINTPETEDLAVAYFQDQVVRLHNHAALIGWLTGSDRIPNPRLEQRYLEIYDAQEYRPYICSAKNIESTVSGLSGTKMEGPYEYVAPDYWYLDTENGGAFGFNTEIGIGANLPQAESLRRMIPEEDLWPLSDVWDYHCTASSSAMNSPRVLQETLEGQYGPAADFDDFVRKAHAVDYDGTRAMFESFRLRMPRTTGIVQWMLNSAWPSLYWQLYDWYGVPTAGYYGTKKANESIQLIFDYKDRKVYAVSEAPDRTDLTAEVQVFDEHSVLLGKESRPVTAEYRSSRPVFDLRRYDGRPHFVALSLTDSEGNVVSDNFYSLPARDSEYDWDHFKWYVTPIRTHADLRFVFAGQDADVQMKVEEDGAQYRITLTNGSSVIVPMNILKAKDGEGQLVVPALWSDNFFALLPGQSKTVTCRADAPGLHFELDN